MCLFHKDITGFTNQTRRGSPWIILLVICKYCFWSSVRIHGHVTASAPDADPNLTASHRRILHVLHSRKKGHTEQTKCRTCTHYGTGTFSRSTTFIIMKKTTMMMMSTRRQQKYIWYGSGWFGAKYGPCVSELRADSRSPSSHVTSSLLHMPLSKDSHTALPRKTGSDWSPQTGWEKTQV